MANQKDDYSSLIELGKKNQALKPRIEKWCKHIQVQQVSGGLLAEATNLPIRMLEVSRPHGLTRSQSMHLDLQAQEFISTNCLQCQFHEEVDPDNYGREVIAMISLNEEREREERIRKEILRLEEDRSAQAALVTEEITEGSVNSLILALLIEGESDPGLALDLL
jgi:hypothetical protein